MARGKSGGGAVSQTSLGDLFRRDQQSSQHEAEWHRRMAEQSPETERRFREGKTWFSERRPEQCFLTSEDGLRLSARLLEHPDSSGTFVLVHGYHSYPNHDFAPALSYLYDALGCSLLVADQRAHGDSEGELITFGRMERLDVVQWCRWVRERMGEQEPIVLWGISMGCASSLLAAATGLLPPNVRGIVADCGYVNMTEEFREVARQRHYPSFLVGVLDRLYCRPRLGFSMKQVDVEREMPKITIPILFVHGTGDRLIPQEHTLRTHAACTAPKRLLLVEGAEHAMAYSADTPVYQRALEEFLEEIKN